MIWAGVLYCIAGSGVVARASVALEPFRELLVDDALCTEFAKSGSLVGTARFELSIGLVGSGLFVDLVVSGLLADLGGSGLLADLVVSGLFVDLAGSGLAEDNAGFDRLGCNEGSKYGEEVADRDGVVLTYF